ncbi:DUF4862 family protein [Leucobacter sp. HY1908]
MSIIVGAYAASPSLTGWQPQLEAEYLDSVLNLDHVRGLELPWPGQLHAHDDAWLLEHLPGSADLVVSAIGHAVGSLAANPSFGLASVDSEGRELALVGAKRLRDDVERLVQRSGRASVVSVELHSAPLATDGSSDALADSLAQISAWDWNGADLVIEHCDTLIAGQRPEKGYLSLDDEIAALEAVGGTVGLALNWGRCAIELRDADLVAEQVARAQQSGLLRGFVFSGASAVQNTYGPAWEDNHPPFAPRDQGGTGEPSSLLTRERAHAALAAAGSLDWVAVKMGSRPMNASVAERVDMIRSAVEIVWDLEGELKPV